jgi:hypothetical protein
MHVYFENVTIKIAKLQVFCSSIGLPDTESLGVADHVQLLVANIEDGSRFSKPTGSDSVTRVVCTTRVWSSSSASHR